MDPRSYGPQQRKANLSDLRKAQMKASMGEVVNACPFGCKTEDLDDLGYCEHLVGVTLAEDSTRMEPIVIDEQGRKRVLGSRLVAVPPGARLVRITTCNRVYAEAKPATKKQTV